jgi:hypothetical protein
MMQNLLKFRDEKMRMTEEQKRSRTKEGDGREFAADPIT